MCRLLLCLVFSWVLLWPSWAFLQDTPGIAPGVKVIAALEGHDVYDWSPDGKQLAYVAEDGVRVVKAPAFKQSTLLIRKAHRNSNPIRRVRWSPDGQRLAFSSGRPGDDWQTLWITDAEGTYVRDLLPPGIGPRSPGVRGLGLSTWLNNRVLTFIWHCGTGCVGLGKVGVDNGLSLHPRIASGGIYWSPTKHAAVTEEELGGLGLIRTSRLGKPYAVLKACPDRRPRMQGPEYYFNTWSPDGQYVLYTGGTPCEWHGLEDGRVSLPLKDRIDLHLWHIEQDHQEKLVSNAGWAAWSPDGTQIAFLLIGKPQYDEAQRIIDTDYVPGQPFPLSVGVMDVETRAVPTVIPLGVVHDTVNTFMWRPPLHLLWSPDSARLVVQDTRGETVLIPTDGSGQRLLIQGRMARGKATRVKWSPDGRTLAVYLPRPRRDAGKISPLEQFLPPVSKEEVDLSDAEVIDHYFQPVLARYRANPDDIGNGEHFVTSYAQALETLGKLEAAEAEYTRGIKLAKEGQEPYPVSYIMHSYAEFLCRQGREKEAAEFEAASPCPAPPSVGSYIRASDEYGFSSASPPRPRASSHPVRKDIASSPDAPSPPSLYIIAISTAEEEGHES